MQSDDTAARPAEHANASGGGPPLVKLNAAGFLLHAASAVLVLILANGFTLPVTASFAAGPPGAADTWPTDVLFEIPTGAAVAAFLALSALAHLLLILPGNRTRYLAMVGSGVNHWRWVEYSLSASLMVVLIAQLVGIFDIAALIAIFGVNTAMILFGWVVELWNRDLGRPASGAPARMAGFWFGCVAGVVPWAAITIYLFGPDQVPTFVFWIFVSLFVFFNSFAVNQWLQYRQIGPWCNYAFGEAAYIVLSFSAKSALAWQVFGGTLAS